MGKKNILIINPYALFPKIMANQDRVNIMVERLFKEHNVDVLSFYDNKNQLVASQKKLKNICRKFYLFPRLVPKNNFVKRIFYKIIYQLYYLTLNYPRQFFEFSHKYYLNKISEIMAKNQYDIVVAEYWFMAKIFEKLDEKIIKVIDTHDVLFEKREQELKKQFKGNIPKLGEKELIKYKSLEMKHLGMADLLLSISQDDYNKLTSILPAKKNILVAGGQDINFFADYKKPPEGNTILFYGSMVSQLNTDAFFRCANKILPLVKKQIPDARLLVVGANPLDSVLRMSDGKNIIVTGYVDDVRNYLSKAKVMLIPLDIAAGLRCRVIEAMAMGIPVIGNHLALDSFQMRHGVHGYITDNDQEIANYTIELLRNETLRKQMQEECIKLVNEKYSIEATYGKLSEHFEQI